MSGENQPTKAKLVDEQTIARTGNHDRRPKSLLPIDNNQNWNLNKPITLISAPGPPSKSCSPSTINNNNQATTKELDAKPSSNQLNTTNVFYTSNVQYANITPNRACSLLVDWDKLVGEENNSKNEKQISANSQMLNVRNPPPELSVSPADTLSKPSSSDNLSAFSPSLNNDQPLNESFTRFRSLQHRNNRKHRKFKQTSPLNSPVWPSSQFDTFNRPSSQPHSPSSLSVNYLKHSPSRDRSYSAGCTSNFAFPTTSSTTAAALGANKANSANIMCSSNHSLIEKQNSGSISPASSINDFTIEIEALEKAIKSNDWRSVKKLLNAHCTNLNRVYSSSSMNLNLTAANQSASTSAAANVPGVSSTTTNKLPSSVRASLFEKLSNTDQQPQSNIQLSSNQSFAQFRAYSAFDSSAYATTDKGLRKESADSQLSNLIENHGRIESPLFNNVLHLAIEYSSIDVVCLLLRNGFSANTNNQTPFKPTDVWRRRSDSSYDSHHISVSQSTELLDASGPLIYNSNSQMGSRLLYSSREQLVPLLSSSPHLLSPSAVHSNGSNINLYALCNNNKMRFSLTSELSNSEHNSELSSIGRYSTSTKLIKMNPNLPYFLKIVRIGTSETKTISELNLKNLLSESKLYFKEFNCCRCCDCKTENLILNLTKQASSKSSNRKISVDTTQSQNVTNRRKSSVSLANVSGIIQHAVQKNVNTLERTLHYHHHHHHHNQNQAHHHNATVTSSINTIGENAPTSGIANGVTTKSSEQLSGNRSNAKNDLNKDLTKLSVCCVSNALNKRDCCGSRYAANRYHCHCPIKEILIKRNLVRKLTKRLTNEKLKFTNDLDLSILDEILRAKKEQEQQCADKNKHSQETDLESIRNYLYLHFKQHRHIRNPFEDNLNDIELDEDDGKEQKLSFSNKNLSLNRLLDTDDENSRNEKEDETSSSCDDEIDDQCNLSKDYTKINSDKSTNESDDEKDDNSSVDKNSGSGNKKEGEEEKSGNSNLINGTPSSVKRKRKRKRKETNFKDQTPLFINDEQRKKARHRRKQKKLFNEETKRCSSVSGQDSDEQQKLLNYENNIRICNSRMHLDMSDDTELSDSSVTFDSEQELNNNNNNKMNKENETTSKDELSDESTCSRPETKKSKKEKEKKNKKKPEIELIELKKKERKLFKKQLTDTSIKTQLETQLNEEKQKLLKSIKTKPTEKKSSPSKIATATEKNELKYDKNKYATFDLFYIREVLYVLPPLFLAVVNGNLTIVKELIKFGANVNCTDANGCTPLHLLLCQQRVNQSLLNLLLANGAKLSITNLAGVAPIDLALDKANQLVGLQRKMIITAFSGLVNGLEAFCVFNELYNKQTMRNQSTTGPNQIKNTNNLNNINSTAATTSTNSTMITTDTISHSHGNQSSRDNQQQQYFKDIEISHTSGVFQSSQSSNTAGCDTNAINQNNQVISNSQTQEHSNSTMISVQQQFNNLIGEEGMISITQPFHSTGIDQQQQQMNLGFVTIDGNSGGSSSGAHSNQTDKSSKNQQQQFNSQLNQSTSNLHPTSELIKKMSQKSQEDGSGFNLTKEAALRAANFLRKLKASAKSSKQKKQQQLLQEQQSRIAKQQQESLQQQADVYLCLEEISSDGASHASNR